MAASNVEIKNTKESVEYRPKHHFVKSCAFIGKNGFNEASFVDGMARLAEDNGMTANDVHHLIAPVLRMLKCDNDWTK